MALGAILGGAFSFYYGADLFTHVVEGIIYAATARYLRCRQKFERGEIGMTYKINDRRASALGGQSRDRSRSAITTIAWHYSAVARSVRKFITGHEEYWKNTLGWDRGGYHFYIDSDANIWQNYDYERITWGVYNNNGYVVHISVEAGNGNDYSPEQVAARLAAKIYG